MIPVTWKLSMIEERCQDKGCFFSKSKLRVRSVHPRKKLSWIRFQVKIFSAARKLNTTEEWRKERNSFFQRGDYRNTEHKPEKLSWIRVPAKLFSLARKPSTTEEWRKGQYCFGEGFTGAKITNLKNSWV
jgi:hypothetical protein